MKPYSLRTNRKAPIDCIKGKIILVRGDGFYDISTALGNYSKVPSTCGKCRLNDQILLLFGDPKNARHPMIIANYSQILSEGKKRLLLPLALWSQSQANQFLSLSVPSDLIHWFDYAYETVWTGTTNSNEPQLGLVITADSKIVVAQALRNLANTAWDRIRLNLQTIGGPNEQFECSTESATGSWNCDMWTNHNASLAFIVDLITEDKIFRKRGEILKRIHLNNSSGLAAGSMNISPLGNVLFNQTAFIDLSYYNDANPHATIAPTIVYVDPFSSESKFRSWNLNVETTVINQAWSKSPRNILTSGDQMLIFSNQGTTRAPCSPDGNSFCCWVSGRQIIPVSSDNIGFMMGYTGLSGAETSVGFRTDVAKTLRAALVSINKNGTIKFKHEITHTAESPIRDSGMFAPIDTWFAAEIPNLININFPPGNDTASIYEGTASHLSVQKVELNAGGSYPFCSGIGDQIASFPEHEIFWDSGIIALPRPASNNAQPLYVGDSNELNNISVFCDWIQSPIFGDIYQYPQIVGDDQENWYVGYLKPRGILFGAFCFGPATGFGSTSNNSNVAIPAAWPVEFSTGPGTTGYTYHYVNMPSLGQAYHTYLRKVDKNGNLIAELDLTQLESASWFTTDHDLRGSGSDNTAIGGTSSAVVPLADNIWKIVPCGRVVFLVLDRHDLGPNLYSACKLYILRSSNLEILHQVELRSTEDLIPTDILDGPDLIFRTGERLAYIDPASVDLRTGYTLTDGIYSAEWAVIEKTEYQRDAVDPTAQSATTLQIKISLNPADAPTYDSGSSNQAGRHPVAKGSWFWGFYNGTNQIINRFKPP